METIENFSEFLKSGVGRCQLAVDLAPDGSPIIFLAAASTTFLPPKSTSPEPEHASHLTLKT